MGARVAEAREARHLTQKELAELVGYDSNYLSKIERGERRASGPLRRKLATALGTTVEAFYGTPAPTAPDDDTDPYPNRRALKLSTDWRDAPDEARAYVAGLHNRGGDLSLEEWLEELRVATRRVKRGERLDVTTDALGREAEEDVVEDPDDVHR